MTIEQELGELKGRVDAMDDYLRSIATDVRALRDAAISVKGGWKMIAVMASVSAALGALASKIAPLFGVVMK